MELYRNKILFSTYLLSLFLLVVAFSMVYVQLGEVQHLLIIHFDSYNEVPDFLGSKDNVYGILLIGLILNVLNAFLAITFYYRERFLSYLLAFSSILISVLILLTISVIIAVN